MDLYYTMMCYYHRHLSWDLPITLHECGGKHADWRCPQICYYFPKRLQFLNVNTVILNSSALSLAGRRRLLKGVCERWWTGPAILCTFHRKSGLPLLLQSSTARKVSSGDLLHHMAPVVNNMVLYASKKPTKRVGLMLSVPATIKKKLW